MRTGTRYGVRAVRLGAVVLAVLLGIGLLAGCGVVDSVQSDESGGYSGEPAIAPGPGFDDADLAAEGEMMAAEESVARTQGTGADASAVAPEDRLIIRDKSLRMEVEDVRATVEEIRDLADSHGAIVTNVNVASDDGPIYRYDDYGYQVGSGEALSGWITIRVPAEEFDALVDGAMDLGEVLWEYEALDDVTQQHVDLQARLATWEAEEEQLRAFFEEAETVEDLLMVQNRLSSVRAEIESLRAQIAYLERQAAMSTVTIELAEPRAVIRPDGPDWGFLDSITDGLQLAANVVRALIVVLLGALPLLALTAIAFFVIRAVVRARRKTTA